MVILSVSPYLVRHPARILSDSSRPAPSYARQYLGARYSSFLLASLALLECLSGPSAVPTTDTPTHYWINPVLEVPPQTTQALTWSAALSQRHVQRPEHQFSAKMMGHRPSHHLAAEHIEHDCQIHEPCPSRHVGDVGHSCVILENFHALIDHSSIWFSMFFRFPRSPPDNALPGSAIVSQLDLSNIQTRHVRACRSSLPGHLIPAPQHPVPSHSSIHVKRSAGAWRPIHGVASFR